MEHIKNQVPRGYRGQHSPEFAQHCDLLITTLIFLSVYFIITLSDLECDYINARSCCSKLNKWVVPEVTGHAVVTVLMLILLHWFIFLLNLLVATWNIYMYIMVPSGNMGVFDPTEIHNRGQLKSRTKEAMIKLGFHLLCFFMYLYRLVSKIAPKEQRNCLPAIFISSIRLV